MTDISTAKPTSIKFKVKARPISKLALIASVVKGAFSFGGLTGCGGRAVPATQNDSGSQKDQDIQNKDSRQGRFDAGKGNLKSFDKGMPDKQKPDLQQPDKHKLDMQKPDMQKSDIEYLSLCPNLQTTGPNGKDILWSYKTLNIKVVNNNGIKTIELMQQPGGAKIDLKIDLATGLYSETSPSGTKQYTYGTNDFKASIKILVNIINYGVSMGIIALTSDLQNVLDCLNTLT